MDAAKLNDALDEGPQNLSLSVRVFRHGCLVAADPLEPTNRDTKFESWSMAKSVTSLMFGRAVELGLISPDDPVGSLLPEADREHGAITMRHLLTMTSGLHWNGLRDYNVFTGFDRVRDALTLGTDHKPGTYFEYAQSPVSLLAEAIGRSAGRDAGRLRPARAVHAAGHRAGLLGLDAGPLGPHRRLLRGADAHRGLRAHGRADAPGRRMEGQAAAVEDLHARPITPTRTNGCYG